MNPDTRMAISLLLSLAVSAENLRLAASGHADIVDVGFRYVIAFVVAFAVVGAVGRVFNDYLSTVDRDADPGDGMEPTPVRLADE